MTTPTNETAILIPIPEAEKTVDKYRLRYDPSRDAGIPAHITLLYPFHDLEVLTSDILRTISDIVSKHSQFQMTLSDVEWFDDRVVYLSPRPASPFLALIDDLMRAFPECPPYGGIYESIIPHLCVAETPDLRAMERVARRLVKRLPITAEISQVWLMAGQGSKDSWHVEHSFALSKD